MKLIDKDALLAEIEKRIRACGNCYILDELTSLHCTFNSIEVKEVDIEKEVIDWWNAHYSSKAYTFEGYSGHYIENSTVIEIAKHFFELGMAVSDKAQKGE